jgi:hypothetical protein
MPRSLRKLVDEKSCMLYMYTLRGGKLRFWGCISRMVPCRKHGILRTTIHEKARECPRMMVIELEPKAWWSLDHAASEATDWQLWPIGPAARADKKKSFHETLCRLFSGRFSLSIFQCLRWFASRFLVWTPLPSCHGETAQ